MPFNHILSLNATIEKCGVPEKTLQLVHLRVSQVNGCAVCLDMHAQGLIRGQRKQKSAYSPLQPGVMHRTSRPRSALRLRSQSPRRG